MKNSDTILARIKTRRDLRGANRIEVRFGQKGRLRLSKTGDSVAAEEDAVIVVLTSSETAIFEPGRFVPVEVIAYYDDGTKITSNAMYRPFDGTMQRDDADPPISTDWQIEELERAVDEVIASLRVIDGNVGDLSDLETEHKNNLVEAINEEVSDLAALSEAVTGKMDKNNPTGTGAFSVGRAAGSTVGTGSFAGGYNVQATGACSHAEGSSSVASGIASHAEGEHSAASGHVSHAEGVYTIASGNNQHVEGKNNVEDVIGKYLHIAGNGATPDNRSNAYTLDWQGNGVFAGGLKIHGADDVMTKTDLSALADVTVIKRETSGTVVSLTDGSGTDVDELIVNIEAVQEGSGDPAPDNVRPIVGWDEVDIATNRKNLYDKNDAAAYIDRAWINATESRIATQSAGRGLVYIPCKPSTTYTVSRERVLENDRFIIGYTRKIPESGLAVYNISSAPNSGTLGETLSLTIATGADARYLVVWVFWSSASEALDTLQIEFGSTATAYEPYRGHTYDINLGQTVYGGTLNVTTGELIITHTKVRAVDTDYSQYTNYPAHNGFYLRGADLPIPMPGGSWYNDPLTMCNVLVKANTYSAVHGIRFGANNTNIFFNEFYDLYTDRDDFVDYLKSINLEITYPIAPITVQLTPTQVATFIGNTNIWANTGDIVNLKYTANASLLINQIIQAIIANGGDV